MRYDYSLIGSLFDKNRGVEKFLKSKILGNHEFKVDEELKFSPDNFNNNTWITYKNGYTKNGTIRFTDNKIRIPANNILPVYETKEYKEGQKPRALVTLSRIIIANIERLEPKEIRPDGFESIEELITRMKIFDYNMDNQSIVSYYVFGHTKFNPNDKILKEYFDNYPRIQK